MKIQQAEDEQLPIINYIVRYIQQDQLINVSDAIFKFYGKTCCVLLFYINILKFAESRKAAIKTIIVIYRLNLTARKLYGMNLGKKLLSTQVSNYLIIIATIIIK